MRTAFALLLSIQVLAQGLLPPLRADQVAGLVEHYHQHQREEGAAFSLTHFMWEHYAADAFHHKHPNHSHAHLPAIDFQAITGFLALAPAFLFSGNTLADLAPRRTPRWENRYAFLFAVALLNPPKAWF